MLKCWYRSLKDWRFWHPEMESPIPHPPHKTRDLQMSHTLRNLSKFINLRSFGNNYYIIDIVKHAKFNKVCN
jgi:hypothetical protein